METTLWNALLSFFSAVILWLLKSQWDEMKRMQILLNRTREEVAKDYVTRADMHSDINRVLLRLDRLDEKLDAFMQREANGAQFK